MDSDFKTSELINVPSFIFTQDDSEGNTEKPIWVQYYNNCITLEQGGEEILLLPEAVNAFFKAVKKNLPEAEQWLKKR